MAVKTIILISPDNAPIVGALLEDGSTCKVIVTYDTVTAHIDTLLDHSGTSNFSQKDGEINCIDSNGHEWSISIVIDHSIFNGLD
jgi:anti-sigma-K factor RskA